jgi:hypothetical protein
MKVVGVFCAFFVRRFMLTRRFFHIESLNTHAARQLAAESSGATDLHL